VTSMEAAQVFAITARQVAEPIGGQVRIRVHASGVSHSDVFTKEGPVVRNRIPPHSRTWSRARYWRSWCRRSEWTKGQRVGVGWHGGHDEVRFGTVT
jgi:hypothetical protein